MADATEVRWIGHSTVLISLDGVRLLTDPLLRLFVKHLRRRARVHPDLGWKLGVGDERGHRPFGEVESLGDVRHRGHHVVRG